MMEQENIKQPICKACLKCSFECIAMDALIMGKSDEESPTYLECFKECTQLDIEEEQQIHICVPCSNELRVAYAFIIKARISHDVLFRQKVKQKIKKSKSEADRNWTEENSESDGHQDVSEGNAYVGLESFLIQEIIEDPDQFDVESNSYVGHQVNDPINTFTSEQQEDDFSGSFAKKKSKRQKNPEQWKRNVLKRKRNFGEAYEIKSSNKIREERKIKEECREKCKLKCSSSFNQEDRSTIFAAYWSMGNIQTQREFINNSMSIISPKYRYTRNAGKRKQRDNNNAFFFSKNDKKIRVCKTFFKNTLDISDRTIRTVQEKRKKMESVKIDLRDLRGSHVRSMTKTKSKSKSSCM